MKRLREKWPDILALAIPFFIFWFDCVFRGHVYSGHEDWQDKEMPQMPVYGRFFREALLPMWNPYVFCGTNFMGTGEYPLIFPPAWAFFVVPKEYVPHVATVLAMLATATGLFFAYRFLSHFAVSRAARSGFAVGLAFSSGAIADLITTPLAYLWLPCLLASLSLTHTVSSRSFTRQVFWQAVTFFILLVNGWSNVHLYAICLATVYPFVCHGFTKSAVYSFFACLAGGAIAIGANGYRMIPFFLHIHENDHFAAPDNSVSTLSRVAFTLRLAFPLLFGIRTSTSLPVPKPDTSLVVGFDPLEDMAGYAGAGVVLLALCAILHKARPLERRLAFAALVLLVSAVTPLFQMIQAIITGMDSIRLSRITYFVPVFTVPLAVLAFERIAGDRDNGPKWARICGAVSLILLCLAVASWFGTMEAADSTLALQVLRFSLVLFAGVSLVVTFAVSRLFLRSHQWVLAVTTICEALFVAVVLRSHPLPFLRPSAFPFPDRLETMVMQMVQNDKGLYRVFGKTNATRMDRGMMWGLRSPAGFENIPPFRVSQVLMYPETHPSRDDAKDFDKPSMRALELTSTRYIISEHGITELSSAIPRFAVFRNFEVVRGAESLLQRLFSEDFPFSSTLLLEEEPHVVMKPTLNGDSIEVIHDDFNSIELRVFASSDALLLINDTWDPGWKATVNGVETRIMRANHAFKAIVLREGTSTVLLKYTSPGLWLGVVVSLASVAILILLFLIRSPPCRCRPEPKA